MRRKILRSAAKSDQKTPNFILPVRTQMQFFFRAIACALVCLMLTACDSSEPEIKTYRVAYPKTVAATPPAVDPGSSLPANHPPVGNAANPPATGGTSAESHWLWDVPEGWTEQSGSGMRMASFTIPGDGMDCSIIALGAAAGSIGANVNRWRGQVGLENVAEEEIIRSLKVANTVDGQEALLCNLVGAEQTIRAAIIRTDHETVFIKMTGPGAGVEQATPAFDALVKSFRHK